MKYDEFSLGQVEAVFDKLGGLEGVEAFLRGELVVSKLERRWREEDNVIYFSVTSNGMTGKQWIARLEVNGYQISDRSKRLLRSKRFKPTNGITTEIAVLKSVLFSDRDLITKKIRAFAAERKLEAPNAEVACLIRETFSDEDVEAMGLLWIVAMHEQPTKMGLLGVGKGSDGCLLCNHCGWSDHKWWFSDGNLGFAFTVSQIPSA